MQIKIVLFQVLIKVKIIQCYKLQTDKMMLSNWLKFSLIRFPKMNLNFWAKILLELKKSVGKLILQIKQIQAKIKLNLKKKIQ